MKREKRGQPYLLTFVNKITNRFGPFFSAFFLVVLSFFAISCSHYRIRENSDSNVFSQIENMHISEELNYLNSPFDALVKDAFKTNKHYINVLNIGDNALLAVIHLIRTAQRSINIQTFIWADDSSGRFVTYELLEAAKRGVKVNIIIDEVGNKQDAKTIAKLATASPNLRVKHYNPIANKVKYSRLQLISSLISDFKKINQRMHNKVFIVDDRIAITGGRNYQDDYYDRGRERNFKDRDCLVIGPVVKQMTDSFMDYWAFKWSVASRDMIDVRNEIENNTNSHSNEQEGLEFKDVFGKLDKRASDYTYIKNAFTKKAYIVESVKFIADGPGKERASNFFKSCSVAEELSRFVSDARKSLLIQTPYLVLPKKGVKVFKNLRRKNPDIDIRISSNSLSTADHLMAYALSYQNKKKYLKKLKWRIFEFKRNPADLELIIPPINPAERTEDYYTCIHAKTYVVDNEKVFIGSFNIDPRSINLNTEAGILIYDKELARDVADDILRDAAVQNSWTIGKSKKMPIIAHFSGIADDILKFIPIMDLWPYGYSASFELIEGKEEIPFYHKDFYKHYNDVGLFPDVAGTQKSIKTRLFKALFAKVAKPLI